MTHATNNADVINLNQKAFLASAERKAIGINPTRIISNFERPDGSTDQPLVYFAFAPLTMMPYTE